MSNIFQFRQPPPGFVTEYYGGGKSSTSTQTVSIPPEVMARYNAVNARAESVAEQPFQQYGGQFVAGLTPTQQAGIQATNVASQAAQPYYGLGAAYTMAGAQDVGPLTRGQIGYYQDPAMLATLAPTAAALRQQQGQQLSQQQAESIKAGAFGGDRSGIQRAQLMGQQQLGMGQALAPIYQQAYQTGLQTAQQQQGVVSQDLARRMQAGQQIAGLGTGAQQAALQGAQAQLQAGTAEQQTQQADLTARYQQFLQERGYPFQVAQFLANIAMGTGALSGSTTTTTQPAGFFSDRRLKHDVERIGETDDGLPIYSYKYNGDDKTQIGLMAQDVEKRKPEAVGLAPAADGNLYKTVDYEKATRKGRDFGGEVMDDGSSMGGAVDIGSALEAFARGGYAVGGGGGLLGEADLNSILKSQQQFLNPYSQGGPYGQKGGPGGQGYVPQSSLPTPKLVTAGGLPQQQKSGAQQAMEIGKGVADIYKTGKEIKTGFGEISDYLKDKMKADGGLIVPRYAYEEGGDVTPGMPDEDDTRMTGNEVNPAGVPKSGFAEGVLESGKRANELAVAKGGPGGGGGGGLGSGLKDVASLIGAGKTLWSAGTAVAEAAPAFFAMFSDERLKDNIRPVGETYDGQNIYAYDMGDGKTQLGLMAQEVLNRKPEAVGRNKDGYLMLDYDRATEDANPFAYGGLAIREHHADGEAVGQATEPPTEADDRLQRTMDAIRRIESGGRYDITGPASRKGDKPYGAYQVMGANIPSWTEEALGKRMTPEEFLADREAQDKTARHRLGLYLQQHNDPRQAASMWFSGRPMEKAGNVTDVLGTSVPKYVSMFDRYYGGQDLATAQDTGSARRPGVIPTGVEGKYAGAPAEKASLGDVVREYAPKGMPTDEKFWVPALGFLGSMLASKSPFLGQAIGEGLVGGVGAYTALNKQQADIKKIEAEAERETATAKYTDQQRVKALADLMPFEFRVGYGWVLVDRSDPTNPKPITLYDQRGNKITDPTLSTDQVKDISFGGGKPSTGVDLGSFKPKELGQDSLDIERPAPGQSASVTSVPDNFVYPLSYSASVQREKNPALVQNEANQIKNQEQIATNATEQLNKLGSMRKQLENLPAGTVLEPGRYANFAFDTVRALKTLANAFGGDLPADIKNAEAAFTYLTKEQTVLGADMQRGLGREPGFILNRLIEANPGPTMTAESMRRLISGMEQTALYERDKQRFMQSWYENTGHLSGALDAFEKLNPRQRYADRAVFYAVPEQDRAYLQQYAANPENKSKLTSAMRTFDKTYGAGSSKIVLGGK